MKKLLFVAAIFAFAHQTQTAAFANGAGVELSEIQSRNWLQSVQHGIKQSEYKIRYDSGSQLYYSPNRAQNLRAIYYENGFGLQPRVSDNSDWRVTLTLAGLSRGETSVEPTAMPAMRMHGNALHVLHDGFMMEYINGASGMRQNFWVYSRIAGIGEPLNVTLDYSGTLQARQEDEQTIVFEDDKIDDADARERVRYTDLKVWDAVGMPLPAWMELRESQIRICVQDAHAVYPILIDPLSFTPIWSKSGEQESALYGYSVASAGDVNNDGYDDIIVGAPHYDNGHGDEGCAFVYHGSTAGPATTASWSADCNQVGAAFGFSVASAGDINNDGFSDVILGAPMFDDGQINEGRAYMFLGSSSGLSSNPDWTADGNQAECKFGFSIAGAGDIDGDNFDDIIVGAPLYDAGQTDEGRVWSYHGASTGLASTASWSTEPNQANVECGFSVASAGDINMDGFDDVIIGAPKFDGGYINEGIALVFHGSPSGLTNSADWSVDGKQAGALFGFSVSTAGDVNMDGFDDVIVGAPLFDGGQINEGRAFVYLGSPAGLATDENWLVESDQPEARLGHAVGGGGDFDFDSFADVIVGAPLYDAGQIDEGAVWVYRGQPFGVMNAPYWDGEGEQPAAQFGWSVANAGDINNDGHASLIVGAPYFDGSLADEGSALLFVEQEDIYQKPPSDFYPYNSSEKDKLEIKPATPNPARHLVEIHFHLNGESTVAIVLTDARGAVVTKISPGTSFESGSHTLSFSTKHLANGKYFATLTAGRITKSAAFVVRK